MSFSPLLKVSVADRVSSQLRDAIADGRYASGQALPSERELVNLFGVSRVSVRSALLELQAEGLLERSHGRATRVTPKKVEPLASPRLVHLPEHPVEKTVHDVKQARLLLEVEMVRMVARSIDATGSEVLRAAVKANRDAIFLDRAAFLETDMALHRAISGLCGNDLFISMGRELLDWLTRFQTDVVYLEGVDLISHREHARIVELIIDHDVDGAAQAMTAHLSRSHQGYGPYIEQQVRAANAPGSGLVGAVL